MKLLHICLTGVYADGYSYQENMLAKYHKQLGYDVEVLATDRIFDSSGNLTVYAGPQVYSDSIGVTVDRLCYKKPLSLYEKLRRYIDTAASIQNAAPDIVFIHGCQFLDIDIVVRYLKKHPRVRVFVDNHADFHNSAQNFLSKNILHKIIWRRCAKKIEPYTVCFYGVLPARVDFLSECYRLPKEKCRLLVMGADDDAVEAALKPGVKKARREAYGAAETDFVIVTGGKIDHNKPQVLTLMDAVNGIADDHVRLVVFGSVDSPLKAEFDRRLSGRVVYIGWRTSEEIYEDFAAADLVAFPGLHSVLWEQAVGMGKPCLFRHIEGFEHIDLGGNCLFFEEDSAASYTKTIQKAIEDIGAMKAAAQKKEKETFSYKAIAKRALEG